MVPETWIREFLCKRNLIRPDGRQLFAYRVSDEEFQTLAQCLQFIFGYETKKVFLVKGLEACLVIYAAEWWRREYNGQFRYRDVLGSVGMDENRLTAQQRALMISMGLSFWNREVRKRNNKNFYLGTLAVEGGIPLTQFANQGGALESLMVRTLKKHLTRNIDLAILVEGDIDYLPQFMRGEEVQEVIVSILDTVASLSREFNLANKADPIQVLTEKCPEWCDRFPFPIGDQHSRVLLEKLIGVTQERVEQSFLFQLTRSLYFEGVDNKPSLRAILEMQSQIPISKLEIADDKKHALEALPRIQVVCVSKQGDEHFVKNAMIGVKNGEKFIDSRFGMQPWKDEQAMDEWWISLRDKGLEIARINIQGASSIGTDLPMVFRNSGGVSDNTFLGEGSQSVRDNEVFVFIPKGYQLETINIESFTLLCSFLGGEIYKLTGQLKAIFDDDTYLVKTGVNSSARQFIFKGRNLSFKTSPAATFIGQPYLGAINTDEQTVFERLENVRVQYRMIGPNQGWKDAPNGTGVYHVRAVDIDGTTMLRKKLGILPNGFSISLVTNSIKPNGGDYLFAGIGPDERQKINVTARSACDLTVKTEEEKFHISIEKRGGVPPAYCDLTLRSAKTNTDIEFRLPFPAIGAVLVEGADRKIRNRSAINLSRLSNYHLMLYRGNELGQNASISLALRQRGVQRQSLTLPIQIKEYVVTIALNDFRDEIRALAALGDTIDGEIVVNVMMHGKDILTFTINPFDIRLSLDRDNQKVLLKDDGNILGNDEIRTIELNAISMHEPENGLVSLNKEIILLEDEVVTEFDFSTMGKGAWIIFQSEESNLRVRPTLWVVNGVAEEGQGEQETQGGFTSLIDIQKIAHPEARAEALKNFFKTLVDDFSHESWEYITTLYAQMKHLPLRTVDIWPLISKDDAMLAAIHSRGHTDISEKLSLEFSICWELVSLNSWIKAINEFDRSACSHMEGQLRRELLWHVLRSITDLSPSLMGVANILSSKLNIANEPQADFTGEAGFYVLSLVHKGEYTEGMFSSFSDVGENEFYSWINDQVDDVDSRLVNLLVPAEYRRANTRNHGVYAAALLPLALASFAANNESLNSISTNIVFQLDQFMSRQRSYVSAMYPPLLCYLYLNEGNA